MEIYNYSEPWCKSLSHNYSHVHYTEPWCKSPSHNYNHVHYSEPWCKIPSHYIIMFIIADDDADYCDVEYDSEDVPFGGTAEEDGTKKSLLLDSFVAECILDKGGEPVVILGEFFSC